jgi:hypothetical protein
MSIGANGNVSIGGNPTEHRLTVEGSTFSRGDMYVQGRLLYRWFDEWKHIQNRAGEWAGSYTFNPSDARFKKDLQPLPSALEKVRKLRGVTYHWNDVGVRYLTRDIETDISAGPNATDAQNRRAWERERARRHKELAGAAVGVIAQDVEAVLPEAVVTDADGYKSVRYHYLIALLIEAIKEQDAALDALRRQTTPD